MAVVYCKMCGGAMEVRPDATTVECEHCGAWQTLPGSLWKLRASNSPVSDALAETAASRKPATAPPAPAEAPAISPAPAAQTAPKAASTPSVSKTTPPAPAEAPAISPAPAAQTAPEAVSTPSVSEVTSSDPAAPPMDEKAAALLYRMLQSVSAGDWRGAQEYSEKVLKLEPECAEAYVGRLMAELHVSRPEQLGNYEWPLDGLENYQKAARFAKGELRAQLQTYLEQTRARIPQHYAEAKRRMDDAYFDHYQDALRILEKIPDYQDAKELMEICKKNIEGEDEPEETKGCLLLLCGVLGIAVFIGLLFFFL